MIRPLRAAWLGLACIVMPSALGAAPPVDTPAMPPCTDNGEACLKSIANLYIDALISHDGAKLPLAPDVRRTENALTNAKGAHEVRESFVRTNMVQDRRFFVIDVDLKAADATATTQSGDTHYKVSVAVPEGTYTVHEAERFKIDKGYIREIEIIAHVENGKGQGSGWPVPRDAAVKK